MASLRPVLIMLAVLGAATGSAAAQLLPKIPPATPPTPEYVPPPTPPAREVAPAETAPPAPDLVKRGADGVLVVYDIGLEEAAVRAYPFAPDRQKLVDASIEARKRAVERFVIDNPEKVRAALAVRPKVENIADFNALFAAREAAQPLIQERLFDRLQREGAMTALQRVRLDEAVTNYETARREEWKTQTGSDPMKIAGMVGRQAFIDSTRDALAALDRLVVASIPTLAEDAKTLALTPEQTAVLDKLIQSGATPDSTRVFIVETLTPDQQKTLLRKRLPGPG